jgi:hypothetical protein
VEKMQKLMAWIGVGLFGLSLLAFVLPTHSYSREATIQAALFWAGALVFYYLIWALVYRIKGGRVVANVLLTLAGAGAMVGAIITAFTPHY